LPVVESWLIGQKREKSINRQGAKNAKKNETENEIQDSRKSRHGSVLPERTPAGVAGCRSGSAMALLPTSFVELSGPISLLLGGLAVNSSTP
jgi:hypothetical protein